MSTSIVVVDYGIGNLHSVVKALRYCDADVTVSDDPAVAQSAERLLVPGVGAFADGMAGLVSRGLDVAVRRFVETGRPLLGICLGMQLLLSRSEEFGANEGFGFIEGDVVEIARKPGRKVPHIGWNEVRPAPATPWKGTPFEGTAEGTMFYFVHSFTAVPKREEDRLADVDYDGARVSAAVRRGNVAGLQFHPEKSGPEGLALLKRFLSM